MNRQELLKDAIRTIAQRAGIERPVFHLTSVSQDSAGVFIMQTMWPEGRVICAKIACAVAGFPEDPYTTCVALLPDLVDELIRVARKSNDETRYAAIVETNRL
jgi:predicted transcriptional regulator